MTDLNKLLPPTCAADPALAAYHLPRAAMMRVNFVPGVRQRLGWRGMRSCPQAPMSLTARIERAEGVFGLHPAARAQQGGTGIATFSLFYFPQVDEEVINTFSIAAGLAVYAADYMDQVRDFPIHEAMAPLFHIADIELRYAEQEHMSLSLVAPRRDRIIAVDGIRAGGTGTADYLVLPGEAEQNLASFDLAFPFFEILAASFSYVFESAPRNTQMVQAGHEAHYRAENGKSWTKPDADNALCALRLAWCFTERPVQPFAAPIDARDWHEAELPPDQCAEARWQTPMVPGARHSIDKNTMGIEELPKLIVLTGFLGSGKTTFLSHFIEYQAARNQFVAIIQNEIGEKGLDARLLGQHYAVEEIDEGCVCCTLIDNLTSAIDQIRKNYQPDFIIVETTGLANPANLLSELSELEDRLQFCSVTCVLDALNAPSALPAYAILKDQIRVSDTILINKTDLAAPSTVGKLEQEVRGLNPFCAIHKTSNGDIPPRELYGVNFEGLHSPQTPQSCGCSHDGHSHQCATHHQYGIRSELWTPAGPVDRQALEAFLLSLPPTVLRVKGLIRFDGEDGLSICQHVQNAVQLTHYRGQDEPSEFLVFIGENLEAVIPRVDEAILSKVMCA